MRSPYYDENLILWAKIFWSVLQITKQNTADYVCWHIEKVKEITIVEGKGGELPLERPTVLMNQTMALERGSLPKPMLEKIQ